MDPSRAALQPSAGVDLADATPERPVGLGAYDVTERIGRGGMGEVYAAVHREHGIRVALKTLPHLLPERLLRFKQEFRSVAGLSHPNLVPLYELGCQGDLWFFTMERIAGVDLVTAVRGPRSEVSDATTWTTVPTASGRRPAGSRSPGRGGPPSLPPSIPRLREVLRELARGVHALHEAGLVHADLKPSNVLVEPAGRVVILDFGLVQPIPSATRGGAGVPPERALLAGSSGGELVGTPAYMAPEQFLGEVSEAADWYAVGLMLYEALTGVPAFVRSAPNLLSYARAHLEPTPPRELLPDAPPDLSALALALLRPDPAERPTGAEVLALLSEDSPDRARAAGRLAPRGIVGRAAEREALRRASERSRAGGMVLIHVIGPSGMGKSALLGSFADERRDEGALVLTGRCYERETVPYKAFDGIVDELAEHLAAREQEADAIRLPPTIADLARVFPVLCTVPSIGAGQSVGGDPAVASEIRRRAVDALAALLARLAARRPVVLRIEDLQWADADSAALLAQLVDAAIPRLLVAASFRGEEAAASPSLAPYLERARGAGVDLVSIEIGALPREDAEALASARLAALRVPPEGLAQAIAAESGGVPFFAEELAHYVARNASTTGDALAFLREITLDTVLARRVRELPDAERALVEALSVANSPIPISVWFSVAGVQPGALRALWALRESRFVRSTGAGADDRIELHHDRMRESVLRDMSDRRILDYHLELGRALAPLAEGPESPWIFDAVRHLGAAATLLEGPERAAAARLDLRAGRAAKRAAAFRLALDCFLAGVALLGDRAWEESYDLALALHGGAAEAAYLAAAWDAVDGHVAAVEAHGRTILDQLVAREVRIDACIARKQYGAALDAALAALSLLGVELPASPGDAEVAAAVRDAMESLARVGPEGLSALPLATDPHVVAAMRLESRISSAAYFARPALLPVIACRLVCTSVERGLSPATPYALAVYGIVLNTLGMLREAHAFGRAALDLLGRVPDRSQEARTRHVVHDLVCVFTVPLAGTLDALRAVVDLGMETGDLEYAAYAAHAWVHNAFYAGRALPALHDEALALGAFMRRHEQINALHVHAPFEQAIRCFLGRTPDPARLDDAPAGAGEPFREGAALAAAEAAGSRSAACLVRLLMGLVRYHLGDVREASALLEEARPFLDGVPSTWHVPVFHQYAALALWALPAADRAPHEGHADQSLAALRAFAAHGPENFAHRVDLVEAERARALGDPRAALPALRRAAAGAAAGGFTCDEALAQELLARCLRDVGEVEEADASIRAARDAYARWGAHAKVARLGVDAGK